MRETDRQRKKKESDRRRKRKETDRRRKRKETDIRTNEIEIKNGDIEIEMITSWVLMVVVGRLMNNRMRLIFSSSAEVSSTKQTSKL